MAYSFEDITSKLKNVGTSNTADLMHNIDTIFQNTLGRNADPSGRQYWVDKIQSGQNSYKTLFDTIGNTAEFQGQQDHLAANPNATAADLKSLDTAYVSPFHPGSGSAVAGWTPGDPLTQAIANAVTTDPNSPTANYSDQTNFTVGQVNAANNTDDAIGGVGDPPGPGTIVPPGTVTPTPNNPTGYLTADDLAAWWEGVDKPWLNTATDTGTNNDDQFMKMMMFMAMMRPQGGGYGGGQYGYGGLNPGGVQSAYNPMANLSGYMDAFKTLPGVSTSTISTGSN